MIKEEMDGLCESWSHPSWQQTAKRKKRSDWKKSLYGGEWSERSRSGWGITVWRQLEDD